jgi:hypothetical protein
MAMVTIHQWGEIDKSLREMRRVCTGPVVILTFDGGALDLLWLAEYVPELGAAERRRYLDIAHVCQVLGGTSSSRQFRCRSTVSTASRRLTMHGPSASWTGGAPLAVGMGFVDEAATNRALERLPAELASGEWDRRHGALRSQPEFVGSLRPVTALPA